MKSIFTTCIFRAFSMNLKYHKTYKLIHINLRTKFKNLTTMQIDLYNLLLSDLQSRKYSKVPTHC